MRSLAQPELSKRRCCWILRGWRCLTSHLSDNRTMFLFWEKLFIRSTVPVRHWIGKNPQPTTVIVPVYIWFGEGPKPKCNLKKFEHKDVQSTTTLDEILWFQAETSQELLVLVSSSNQQPTTASWSLNMSNTVRFAQRWNWPLFRSSPALMVGRKHRLLHWALRCTSEWE